MFYADLTYAEMDRGIVEHACEARNRQTVGLVLGWNGAGRLAGTCTWCGAAWRTPVTDDRNDYALRRPAGDYA